ncbi:MAG: AAA family ATPase [Firmicutes bacterium]|uniref:AAA family ATPase n=1 Tax=Candidatus Onthovivens merdipullorum TaxID=2840889 RepID=A0A9D9DGE1_9BACL|nr:AAA family ATPase [Candidatus Onthovivens merdipullorum]
MILKLPLGIDIFKNIIENNGYFVDKTLAIDDIFNQFLSGTSFLFNRPRRFGKSIFLSMLHTFFSSNVKEKVHYFKDTLIYNHKEYFTDEYQFPCIFLNFKEIDFIDLNEFAYSLNSIINKVLKKYPFMKDEPSLSLFDKKKLQNILNGVPTLKDLEESFSLIVETLYRHYGKKVVILIDEYDVPLRCASGLEIYEKVLTFFKNFYGSVLKSNEYIEFSFLTGVLDFPKESLFSGVNNLISDTILHPLFNEYFGFTDKEVKEILDYYGAISNYDDVKKWYDGYIIGDKEIYNPWSILSYLRYNKMIGTYWNNSGSNKIFDNLFKGLNFDLTTFLKNIYLENEKVFSYNTQISYKDIKRDRETLLLFLLNTGYLTLVKDDNSIDAKRVKIPNKEVSMIFSREIVERYINKDNDSQVVSLVLNLRSSFLNKDYRPLVEFIKERLLNSFTYYENNEKTYQVILLTLVSTLFKEYIVEDEVNTKLGRCDIVLKEINRINGVIIEIKFINDTNVSKELLIKKVKEGLTQIKEHKYYQALTKEGYKNIDLISFCFSKDDIEYISEKFNISTDLS